MQIPYENFFLSMRQVRRFSFVDDEKEVNIIGLIVKVPNPVTTTFSLGPYSRGDP